MAHAGSIYSLVKIRGNSNFEMITKSISYHFLLVSNYSNLNALTTLIYQIERLHTTYNYCIHVITENQEEIDLLQEKLSRFNLDINFYAFDVNSTGVSSELYLEKNGVARIAYSKIFAANILPLEITKVVYLDTDVLILKDLSMLFKINFSQSIAACVDSNEGQSDGSPEVFNSGVMVLNLSAIRIKWNLDEVKLAFEENLVSRWMDMTILRKLFLDDWFELPTSFNFIINGRSQKYYAEEDISIVHFAGHPKPWTNEVDSVFDIYWRWLNFQAIEEVAASSPSKNGSFLGEEFLYDVLNRLYHSLQSGEIASLRHVSKPKLEATRSELEGIKSSNSWQVLGMYRHIKKLFLKTFHRHKVVK